MTFYKSAIILGITSIVSMPTVAQTVNGLSYDFFEVDYINLDIDGFDENGSVIEDFDDGNGYALRAQVLLNEYLLLFGDYSETDSDATFRDSNNALITENQDVKRFNIGLGLRSPVNQKTDLIGRLAYSDIDYGDFNFGGSNDSRLSDLNDDSSDGFFMDGRIRTQWLPSLEASAGLRYTDIEQADNFSFVGNLLYEISSNWGINFEVDVGDEIGVYSLGIRFSR